MGGSTYKPNEGGIKLELDNKPFEDALDVALKKAQEEIDLRIKPIKDGISIGKGILGGK